ncbi:MAG: hypothetical protein ACE5IR_25645 [bacterium]
MQKKLTNRISLNLILLQQGVAAMLVMAFLAGCSASDTTPTSEAEASSADQVFSRFARYGADVWAKNPAARISGEGQACISCHTSLPYALVEPLLPGTYPAYTDLIKNINNRILTWSDNTAWYSDDKLEQTAALGNISPDVLKAVLNAAGSRGVEAIFNAFIRAMHDAYSKKPAQLETQRAFENMWAEQIQFGQTAGRWKWIQVNLIPWEVADSDIWGAALACVAASLFPELAPQDNLKLLHATLRQASTDDKVSLHVKSAILWCDAETGGQLLEKDVARQIMSQLLERQHQNGGWALRELGPWTGWEGSDSDCCGKRDIRPDAYATGFVTLALARNLHQISGDDKAQLDKAVAWIERQLQNPYPAEPRHNKHESAEAELPEFRNNLYTNAGHMWAFLARTVYKGQKPPWVVD